eukprot:9182992-Pyramimonas_sp.AAC.1
MAWPSSTWHTWARAKTITSRWVVSARPSGRARPLALAPATSPVEGGATIGGSAAGALPAPAFLPPAARRVLTYVHRWRGSLASMDRAASRADFSRNHARSESMILAGEGPLAGHQKVRDLVGKK